MSGLSFQLIGAKGKGNMVNYSWRSFDGFSPDGRRPCKLYFLESNGRKVTSYLQIEDKRSIDLLIRSIYSGARFDTKALPLLDESEQRIG